MSKLIGLILVTLSLVACGGEPFSADSAGVEQIGGADSGAVAGEAGSADTGDAGEGYGGTSSGGSSSTAGKPPVAGSSPGGSPAAGGQPTAGTGGVAPSCELDTAKLTAALPTSFTWDDFSSPTPDDRCVACKTAPCAQFQMTWGSPDAQGPAEGQPENTFVYSPKVASAPIVMAFGASGGSCSAETECSAQSEGPGLTLTVARTADGWMVVSASTWASVVDSECLGTLGAPVHLMGEDLRSELREQVEETVVGLEIPCR